MRYINAAIVRILSLFHCLIVKAAHIRTFSFAPVQIIQRNVRFSIEDNGCISIGNKCGFRQGCEICVREQGKLKIGNHCFFNSGCIVVAHESITIGDNTRFGPNVLIYDHDYDYKKIQHNQRCRHKKCPVKIGEDSWIGAGTIILRGTTIGSRCVIGAGCVLKGNYPNNSFVVQKRNETIEEIRR